MAQVCLEDKSLRPALLRRQDIAMFPEVRAALEAPELFNFFENIFESPVATLRYKWLRAVSRGDFTGLHCDRVYMGDESPRLLTTWIPLGAVPSEQGSLLVCPEWSTHPCCADLRASYGQILVGSDGLQSGWLGTNPNELPRPTIYDSSIVDSDHYHISTIPEIASSTEITDTPIRNPSRNLQWLTADFRFSSVLFNMIW